jgi:hypothetical protein
MAPLRSITDRIRVASPCRTSWEGMRGDERRRYCVECERHVYDFAQLTAREVAGLIEATGGALCARLTRDGDGRLVTLAPPAAAEPFGARRATPLAAAAVAAALGLGGAMLVETSDAAETAAAASTASPATGQEAGRQPAESPPQRLDDAGGSLAGTLATDGGKPIPGADVTIHNRLDRRERAARTDENGRFAFAALPAGVYELDASFHGRTLAEESSILLRAGETGRIALGVPAESWERVVAGDQPTEEVIVGGVGVTRDPVRNLYADSGLVVFGVARTSVVVRREQFVQEVRTDLVLTSVVKGETRERVISVFHREMPFEDAASRIRPGDRVLAFLDPRAARSGRGWDGYAAHSTSGLRTLSEAEAAAYGRRLEALARVERRGETRPADLVEWLVATAEDPATRGEAVGELAQVVWALSHEAEKRGTLADRYAEGLRAVLADFLAAGGRQEGEADPAVLGAFLTDAHRERLTAALLRTTQVAQVDLDLYELVRQWHDERALPWLIGRLEAGEPSDWPLLRAALSGIAWDRADKALAEVVDAGSLPIDPLAEELAKARDETARQRLDAKLRAAEDELRHRFLEALAGRPGAGSR